MIKTWWKGNLMEQVAGQIGLFDKPINEKNESLGEPCMYCDIEWCSAKCFIRRGYMWDSLHRFVKGSDGKPLRKRLSDRICKATRFD